MRTCRPFGFVRGRKPGSWAGAPAARAGPLATSTGTSTSTGPGRPASARCIASAIACAMSSGRSTAIECLTIGAVMPITSASWKALVPRSEVRTWPVTNTVGTESMCASQIGVTRFVAPGPEVAKATPTRPVARAYPSAA